MNGLESSLATMRSELPPGFETFDIRARDSKDKSPARRSLAVLIPQQQLEAAESVISVGSFSGFCGAD